MSSAELKTHASEGRIKPDSGIQKIGNEEWVPASTVAALWMPRETPSAAPAHDSHAENDAHATRAGSSAGNHSTNGNGNGNGGSGGGTGIGHTATGGAHPSRIGESIQHLLQRAVLGHVTVCAPEFDAPQRVILAGVTNHDVAFEFEGCGSVVYIPYTRLRSVTVPRQHAHSSGRIRSQSELLVIEVEHIPEAVARAAVTAHSAT